ncbi:hypothetical protein IWQ61_006587 [Dispira simplex]|nr:hypothetical protein IWQ61_006587 [Dispira simplex]
MAGSIVTFTCTLLIILALYSDRCAGRQRSSLTSVESGEGPFQLNLRLPGDGDSSLHKPNPNQLVDENTGQMNIRDNTSQLTSPTQPEETYRNPTLRKIVLPGGLPGANNAVLRVTENPPGRKTSLEEGKTKEPPLSKTSLTANRTAPQSNGGVVPSGKTAVLKNDGSLIRNPLEKNLATEQTPNKPITHMDSPNMTPQGAQLPWVTKLGTPAPKVAVSVAKFIRATPKNLPPNNDSAPASATAQKPVKLHKEPKSAEVPPAAVLVPQPFAPEIVSPPADSPEFKEDMTLAPLSTGNGKTYRGDITYFKAGMGACGVSFTDDELVAAIHVTFFTNESNPNEDIICGKRIKIMSDEKKSVIVTIRDKLPAGKEGDIDLTEEAFTRLYPKEVGRFVATWEFVS